MAGTDSYTSAAVNACSLFGICHIILLQAETCGACLNTWYMKSFKKFDGMECCECGCCSYICPAKRQLTQMIKSMRKMVLASRKKK